MSGTEISFAWRARSIALGETLIPIGRTEKAVLARMLDSADHAFIVSYMDEGTVADELSLGRRAVKKVFAHLQCCPPFPVDGSALRETPAERKVKPGVRSTLLRTRDCGPPGGRCRHHLGVFVSASVLVFGSPRRRAYRIAVEHFRDRDEQPLPVHAVHRTGARGSSVPVRAVHPYSSYSSSSGSGSEKGGVSAQPPPPLAKATSAAAAKGNADKIPKGLEQKIIAWEFGGDSSRFTTDSAARLWIAARRGKRDCTESQVIHAVNCLIEGARHKRARPIADWPGFLISYIEGAMLLPPIAQPCLCERRGTCDHCKAVEAERRGIVPLGAGGAEKGRDGKTKNGREG